MIDYLKAVTLSLDDCDVTLAVTTDDVIGVPKCAVRVNKSGRGRERRVLHGESGFSPGDVRR